LGDSKEKQIEAEETTNLNRFLQNHSMIAPKAKHRSTIFTRNIYKQKKLKGD